MGVCGVCGNDYDKKTMQVLVGGEPHVFDSLACAHERDHR